MYAKHGGRLGGVAGSPGGWTRDGAGGVGGVTQLLNLRVWAAMAEEERVEATQLVARACRQGLDTTDIQARIGEICNS